jgi:hypothetical protein
MPTRYAGPGPGQEMLIRLFGGTTTERLAFQLARKGPFISIVRPGERLVSFDTLATLGR